MDLRRGVLTLNAPRAEGAVGFLSRRSPIELGVLRIETGLEYGALLAVPLDGEPLARSKRVLVEVVSELQNTGFLARGAGKRTILNVGHAPIQLRRLDGRVTLRRPNVARLQAIALDANGRRLREARDLTNGLVLLPDALYYLLVAE